MSTNVGVMLLLVHVDDPDFRECSIPTGGNRVEDETEILLVARLEGRSGNRLHIYIRFSHSDEFEGLGFVLSNFVGNVAKKNLGVDSGDGPTSHVRNVTIEVGNLTPGEVRRLAHRKIADAEIGSIRVGGR